MLVQLHAYKIACGYPSYGLRCDIRPNSSLPIPQPISRRPMPYCGASYKVGKLPDPHTSKRLRIKASPHFPHKSGLSHYKVRLPDRQTTVRPAAAFEIPNCFSLVDAISKHCRHKPPASKVSPSFTSRNSTALPINATIFAGSNFRQIQSSTSNTLSCPYTGKCPYIVRTAFSA